MIIAIDDAGDPGFKLGRGSTEYFAIAAVFFDDDLDAEEVALKIKRLRRHLNWNPLHEFKFRKTSAGIKKQFFSMLKPLSFRTVVVLINKNTIVDKNVRENPSKFYNTAILEAIKACGSLHRTHIYIDGEKGNDYRRRTKTFFRQHLSKDAIKDLTYKDSKEDNLIQLADMIAGAALHSVEKREDATIYISLIKKHIETTVTIL